MDNDSSNTLFFIVGGLVVAALIFSFVYYGKPRSYEAAPQTIAPAAGGPADQDQTRFDMKIDQNGAQGTITDTDKQP